MTNPRDVKYTKPYLAEGLLEYLPATQMLYDTNAPTMLDPGAGSGVWGQAAKKRWPFLDVTGVETRQLARPSCYDGWVQGDYRLYRPAFQYDLVLGNPPFSIAEQIIRHSMELLVPGGYLCLLLRLGFLASEKRYVSMYREGYKLRPALVQILSLRPSFIEGSSDNDMTEYAMLTWRKGYTGRTEVDWLYIPDPERSRSARR